MKPLRLFVVLVLLTASALTIVYFRVSSVRTAYNVQKLHARQRELRETIDRQEAEIARWSNLRLIRQSAGRSGSLTEHRLPSLAPDNPQHRPDWEHD